MKHLSDEELAAGAQAGSHPFFEELVYRYSRRLFHYLRAKISTDQDAEDLVQETFLKAYRNIDRFNQKYRFSTWIYTTAARLAISHYRKKREVETSPGSSDLDGPASGGPLPDPQERMIREENYENLWNVARCLRQNQYRALWLRYVEDMSVKEIAGVMNKTQVHVRVLVHRALLNLTRMLGREEISHEGREAAVSPAKELSLLQ